MLKIHHDYTGRGHVQFRSRKAPWEFNTCLKLMMKIVSTGRHFIFVLFLEIKRHVSESETYSDLCS